MHYRVRIDRKRPYQIHIEARLPLWSDSSRQRFQLPVWRPGRYQRFNFAQYIQRLEVTDSYGHPLPNCKVGPSTWEVDGQGGDEVVFNYCYYGDTLDAGRTFWDGHVCLLNPVSCCIYPLNHADDVACELEIKPPESWEIVSLLPAVESSDDTYRAQHFHHLADSPFLVAESLYHDHYACEGATFHLWSSGAAPDDPASVRADFHRFSSAYHQMLGRWPFEAYHFLLHAPPTSQRHGLEHQYGTVLILGPAESAFRGLYHELLGVASHELFHAWNVKAIKPQAFSPYDYTEPPTSPLGYIYEGATTYYGDLMLLRSGVFNWEAYRQELATLINRHLNNPGRRQRSVADSSRDTELDGYQRGVPHRKSSIYVEGAVLCMILDGAIRRATAHEKSLDDVFRSLDARFGVRQEGYTESALWAIIDEVAGTSMQSWREQYFHQTQDSLPQIHETFDYLGLVLQEQPAESLVQARLGMKLRKGLASPGPEVMDVTETSPWYGAVVRGDVLLSWNGDSLQIDLGDDRMSRDAGRKVEVQLLRQGRVARYNLEVPRAGNLIPHWDVARVASPTSAQQAAWNAWSWNAEA